MSADRFAEVERLYHEATLRRPEERSAFLDQACGGDDALRHEVESLLSLPTDGGQFLSRTALEEAARTSHRPSEPDTWPTIPGYTLRRVLGEGGMGVVFLAEQETPLRRLVALKLIKPGMDTRQVVARFETERQALALMDHPNIAAVFDAGSTDNGRPYFVMEYVDGVSITDYCDRRRLSTRDRLALFVEVCAAVQHAHQKGVIHRDLKPSNVLVAERDGRALPKVIDFGTAKAIGGAWTANATQSAHGMVLGTLEYMSPEQAELSADIDTATDVYSLGVLLYELLVGRLPFDTGELRRAGYAEMQRIIREEEPPKPSTKVGALGETATDVAGRRQTDAGNLRRQLAGDLDWITLKALEKDRTRRYASASEFAADISRHLHDEPVVATPPSATYRARKFVRRNRVFVSAAGLVAGAVVAGLVVSGVLYLKERNARVEADAERQRADVASATAVTTAAAEIRQRQIAEAATAAEGAARKRADVESERAIAERDVARVNLARRLYQQAISVRLAGRGGRRWIALDALREAEALRKQLAGAATRDVSSRGAGDTLWKSELLRDVPIAIDAPLPAAASSASVAPQRWQLRSQAVEALMLNDAHITRAMFGAREAAPPGMLTLQLGAAVGRFPAAIGGLRPDSPLVFSQWVESGQHRGIRVFDYRDGRDRARLTLKIQTPDLPFAISRDGTLFASLEPEQPVVMSLPDGAPVMRLILPPAPGEARPTSPSQIAAVAFDAPGRSLVAVRENPATAELLMWDLGAGDEGRSPVVTPIMRGSRFAMSADGKLAFVSDPRTIRVINRAASPSPTIELKLPSDYSGGQPAFDETGEMLVTTSQGRTAGRTAIQTWRLPAGSLAGTFELSFAPKALTLAPGGRFLAGNDDRDLVIIDLSRRAEVLRFPQAWQVPVRTALAWSQGADRLTSVGGPADGLAFWKLQLSELVRGLGPVAGPMFGFDRSGNWFPVLSRDPTRPDVIRLVNAEDGTERTPLPLSGGRGTGVALLWSAIDGSRIGVRSVISGNPPPSGPSHIVDVVDISSGATISHKDFGPTPGGNGVISGAFLPNGELHVVHQTVQTKTAVIWNVTTNREVWRPPSDAPRFSSTGRHVYGPVDGRLNVWSYPDKVRVNGVPTKAGDRGIDVSADGSSLLTTTEDMTLNVWDLKSGRRRFDVALETPRGIVSTAVSVDGRYLCVAYSTGWIELWNMMAGIKLFEWRSPLPQLARVSFSPNGERLSLQGPSIQTHVLDLESLHKELAQLGLGWLVK